jgi:hypothetical protein
MQVKGKYLELRLEKADVLERLEAECGEEDLETIINNGTLKLEDADLHGNFYKTFWRTKVLSVTVSSSNMWGLEYRLAPPPFREGSMTPLPPPPKKNLTPFLRRL